MPKITLITPIYNRAILFERTFKSVAPNLAQNMEYIIVSDGSTDIEQLEKFVENQELKSYVQLLHYSENGGVGKALNFGIRHAQGEWITFLGSDDELVPNWFELISEAIDKEAKLRDFFYHKLLYIDGRMTPTLRPTLENLNFENYLRYIDEIMTARKSDPEVSLDMGVVISSKLAKETQFSEGWTYENGWHLEINYRGSGCFLDIPLKLIHVDSNDRLSISKFYINSSSDVIKNYNQKSEFRNVLNKFGDALWKYSPEYFLDVYRKEIKRSANLLIAPKFTLDQFGFYFYLKNILFVLGNVLYYQYLVLKNFVISQKKARKS